MGVLLRNIKGLAGIRESGQQWVAGKDMAEFPQINDGWLLMDEGRITNFGAMENCPDEADTVINLKGQYVLPAWCDSHTHIIYDGSREGEFEDRIKGLSYEDIANRGGGILNSAKKVNDASEDALFDQAMQRVQEVISMGTGALEIKSGYALTVDGELKMLRVAKRIKKEAPIPVKTTFLGAHAFPSEYKNDHDGYIDLIINQMLPEIAQRKLADYVDVFCERGYFSLDETGRILSAAAKYGLQPKIHVNQFSRSGGVKLAVDHDALSVDHLEELGDEDIAALQDTRTMPVALPSCSFFLNIPYTPARKIIDSGLPLAMATDYNPGSTPSGNMPFLLSLAAIYMKMLPEESLNAITLNGAYALELTGEVGSITKGKRANLIITKPIPSLAYLPYKFGSRHIDKVIINGSFIT